MLRVRTDEGIRHRRFSGTYSQAEAALALFRAELERASEETSPSFAEYANGWLAAREAGGEVADQTLAKDGARVRNLEAFFGAMPVDGIRRPDVQRGLQAIRDGRNASGRRLTGTTMNGIHQTFRQIMQDAVYDGYAGSNPVATVRAPRRDTQPKAALSPEDVLRVLSRLDLMPYDGHTVAVRFAVLAGNRRGEIVGYEWRDIRDGCAHVERSVSGRTGAVKEPKTRNGVRAIPLLPPLAEALEAWRLAPRRPDERDEHARHGDDEGEQRVHQTSLRPKAQSRLKAAKVAPNHAPMMNGADRSTGASTMRARPPKTTPRSIKAPKAM